MIPGNLQGSPGSVLQIVQGEVGKDTLIFNSAPFLSWLTVADHFKGSQPHLFWLME